MSDRQELIDWLRHWKHEVPTTREREEMIEAMRDAATALEEAQGVPRERNAEQMRKGQDYCAALAAQINEHGAAVFTTLWRAWCAGYDAAPAAPTREPVSAATPRDEQDARRYRWLRDYRVRSVLKEPILARVLLSGAIVGWDKGADQADAAIDAAIDAALAEPKR